MHSALSVLPAGDRLNFVLQRHVTHSLPVSDAVIGEYLATARSHLDAVGPRLEVSLGEARFFEFGAGWTLGTALALAGLGVGRQFLVDIRPLARLDLVTDVVDRLRASAATLDLAFDLGPVRTGAVLEDVLDGYGITYLAPGDARATGLPAGSIDVVTSTSVLEHIPPDDISSILLECHRLLSAAGVVSLWIDYKDHYAAFDDRISPYNFLQFSERRWRWYSPSLHHQNRLRHEDYARLIRAAGFDVVEVETVRPGSDELAALRSLGVDGRFDRYSEDELAVVDAHFIARPIPADARS
jgi:hypothetical protein